jgi:hypothetical protein
LVPATTSPIPNKKSLAAVFRRFADFQCGKIAPLYGHLARAIADDEALLALCLPTRPGLPLPNLLLASVHHLLLRGAEDSGLRAYYPDLCEIPAPAVEAFPAFRAFCLSQEAAILELMARRGVTTSEVQRSACLLPGFLVFAAEAPAFHLLDVGAGAGFNLLWDRYAYDYGDGTTLGRRGQAQLLLRIELRGTAKPPLHKPLPKLLSRLGIDLEPPDLEDPLARDWLRALVWPEQPERRLRLEQAMDIVQRERPAIIAGDALEILPKLLAGLPAGEAACVSHAFCLNQLDETTRRRFDGNLRRASQQRLLGRVSLEWPRRSRAPELRLRRYLGGASSTQHLARADAHGAWLEWLG